MNIFLLTQLHKLFWTCRIHFKLVLKLFTPFNTFSVQYLLGNVFDTSKEANIYELKGLYSFIFKVYGLKCIEVSDINKF